MDLSGFKPVILVSGKDTMTVSNAGVSFSQATIAQLGKPEYVKALINSESRQFVIQVVGASDPSRISFFRKKKKNMNVRWNNSILKNELSSLMGWDLETFTYRIDGDFHKEENLMLFDLSQAKSTKRKGRL
ncbi:MAG: hypothetical protein MR804_09400 [Limosilactobacillus reuteri]|nr:hypothetical protein [Limosilactobacillus reuteri]